jgi:hypothetical protein
LAIDLKGRAGEIVALLDAHSRGAAAPLTTVAASSEPLLLSVIS